MGSLKLKDVKIELPSTFKDDVDSAQFTEWLEFECGICNVIALSNPLSKIELKDCTVKIGSAYIDGNRIDI